MRERRFAIYFGLVLFLIAAYFIRLNFQEKPTVIPKNQEVTFVATVKTQPRLSDRFQIIEVGDSRLFAPLYPKYMVGDRLKVEGFVESDPIPSANGGLRGASGRIFNARVDKIGEKVGVLSTLADLRQQISGNIDRFLPVGEAALVKGMVLGVDEIDRDMRETLVATGTIHVVVVSGQNLSIVAGLFLGLVKYIGRRQSLILATGAVFFYALLTGFEPPVVRASLMVLAATLAIFLGRQSMPILNLILAALLILFIWPQALLEISFQLTFAATLGIMTLGQWMIKVSKVFNYSSSEARTIMGSVRELVINNAAVATSAYLFTTPIIWWHFERISLLAPVVNTLVAELVAPIMILGFAVAGASIVFVPLAQFLAYLVYVPALVFIKIIELFV